MIAPGRGTLAQRARVRAREVGAAVLERLVAAGEAVGVLREVGADRGGVDDPPSRGRYWTAADGVTGPDGRTRIPASDPVSASWGLIDPPAPHSYVGGGFMPPASPGAASAAHDVITGRTRLVTAGPTYEDVRTSLVTAAWADAGLDPWSWVEGPRIVQSRDGQRWTGTATIAVGRVGS